MSFLLKIVEGPNKGAEIALVDGVMVTLGKGDDRDIVLADRTMPDAPLKVAASADGVTLSGGDSLSVEWEHPDDKVHDFSFVVEVRGEGTLAYTVAGGEPVEVVATGEPQTVEIKNVSGALDVQFDFVGEGSAVVSQFNRGGYGLMLILK